MIVVLLEVAGAVALLLWAAVAPILGADLGSAFVALGMFRAATATMAESPAAVAAGATIPGPATNPAQISAQDTDWTVMCHACATFPAVF